MLAILTPIIAIIFCIIQIGVFKTLPIGWRKLLVYFPIFGFGINMIGSYMILAFTGTAILTGIANLIASVIFGAYILIYRHVHQINKIATKKLLKIIPIPYIEETNPNPAGITGWIF